VSPLRRIDLHTHSTASDGTDPPDVVVRRAREAGLDVVALTDHDTVDGIAGATAALPEGLTLVPGCELSCSVERHGDVRSVHLLGYLFDPDEPAFAAERAALRTDRERRGRAMVDLLRELGVDVTWDAVRAIAGDAPVGRPHVARALLEAGAVRHMDDAFTREWIGNGGRAYVAKQAPDVATAIALVSGAGGVSVLAHPWAGRRDPAIGADDLAGLADAGLAGVEVDHPDHPPDVRDRLRAVAVSLDLLVTGSSDDHGGLTGHRLGCELTDDAAYDAIVERGQGATPVCRSRHT
jgi:predicted metal-dependent phosphoesterase TrpH